MSASPSKLTEQHLRHLQHLVLMVMLVLGAQVSLYLLLADWAWLWLLQISVFTLGLLLLLLQGHALRASLLQQQTEQAQHLSHLEQEMRQQFAQRQASEEEGRAAAQHILQEQAERLRQQQHLELQLQLREQLAQFEVERLQQQELVQQQALAHQMHEEQLQATYAEELAKSQSLLERLAEQVPGALFQLEQRSSGELRFPYCSNAINDLFELSAEQLRTDATPLLNLIAAEDAARLQQALATPEQALACDLQVQLPQQGLRWRACNARAQVEADGVVVWHGFFMDITERMQQEQQIRAANARADAANQAKSAYLSQMTHEIRTPMNIILGMSYLAMETELNASQRDYLDNIRLSAEHLLALINDILDMSKIEAGQLEVETIDFDLHEILQKLNKLMSGKIIDKGLQFAMQIAPEVPPALRGDPVRLSQVLMNFITNAVKFTHQGSITLAVSLLQQDEHKARLMFAVEDTGIGMNEVECGRMFQQFQQADASISRKYGGTGLGLAISKQLVELMGGQVGLESTPGKGSRFWFQVEVEKNLQVEVKLEQNAQQAQAAAAQAKAAMQGKRILLVEDQPLNQRVAQAMLRNAGAFVEIAGHGQEALDILRSQSFDCVLMDMQMPVMDGVAATRAIRDDPALADQLVIAMTANASMHNQALCMAAGMNDFITKPIKPALLYAVLEKWLVTMPREQAENLAPHNISDSFNLSRLSQLVGDDPRVLRRFALMFADTMSQTMADMQNAHESGNWPLLMTLAQSLHSEAISMDAIDFAQLCNQLQRLPGPEALPQAAEIIAHMRPLAAQIDRQIATLPE